MERLHGASTDRTTDAAYGVRHTNASRETWFPRHLFSCGYQEHPGANSSQCTPQSSTARFHVKRRHTSAGPVSTPSAAQLEGTQPIVAGRFPVELARSERHRGPLRSNAGAMESDDITVRAAFPAALSPSVSTRASFESHTCTGERGRNGPTSTTLGRANGVSRETRTPYVNVGSSDGYPTPIDPSSRGGCL